MDWEREQGREGKERERGLGTGETKTVRERDKTDRDRDRGRQIDKKNGIKRVLRERGRE